MHPINEEGIDLIDGTNGELMKVNITEYSMSESLHLPRDNQSILLRMSVNETKVILFMITK